MELKEALKKCYDNYCGDDLDCQDSYRVQTEAYIPATSENPPSEFEITEPVDQEIVEKPEPEEHPHDFSFSRGFQFVSQNTKKVIGGMQNQLGGVTKALKNSAETWSKKIEGGYEVSKKMAKEAVGNVEMFIREKFAVV
jgi:hypothetical protein